MFQCFVFYLFVSRALCIYLYFFHFSIFLFVFFIFNKGYLIFSGYILSPKHVRENWCCLQRGEYGVWYAIILEGNIINRGKMSFR